MTTLRGMAEHSFSNVCLLFISTCFWVLCTPKSWSNYFFNFCSFFHEDALGLFVGLDSWAGVWWFFFKATCAVFSPGSKSKDHLQIKKVNNDDNSLACLYKWKFVFLIKIKIENRQIYSQAYIPWYDNFGVNQTQLQRIGMTAIKSFGEIKQLWWWN